MNQKQRIAKVRQRYGKDIFRHWGKRGGSPILIAYREGRVRVVKNG